jgi:hypothetical protein
MNAGPHHVILAATLSLVLCHAAAAEVTVTFPLQGHYRPGKYMPVRVTSTKPVTAPLVLQAEGAVAVSVAPESGPMNVVVPFLATEAVRSARWEITGVGGGTINAALAPVEPQQVLVGIVGTDAAAATATASELFPGRSVVPVALVGTPPLPGHPAAWEALDVVVFDAADHVFLAELLGRGVSVVVRSQERPGGRWAWQGGPGNWFVRFDAAGPLGIVHPEVYEAVAAWAPGWPAPQRRRAALLAVVFCTVALGATLLPRRRAAAVGVVVVCGMGIGAFAWWGGRQPMVCDVTTAVEVIDVGVTQTDRWTFYRPLADREVAVDWSWRDKPVFASRRHLSQTDLVLHAGPTGRPVRFAWRAAPGTTLAFLGRAFFPTTGDTGPAAPNVPPSPAGQLVAAAGYLSPGDVVLDGPADAARDDASDWSTRWWPEFRIRRAAR